MFVAILEDHEPRRLAMQRVLDLSFPLYGSRQFDSVHDMTEWLTEHLDEVALVSLDHDLGPSTGTGLDVAEFLAERNPSCPVVVHTSNRNAAESMMFVLGSAGWTATRVAPVGESSWVDTAWAPQLKQLLTK